MENFKEIAEKCFAGELSGTFVLRDNRTLHSKCLIKMKGCLCPYYIDGYYYSDNGNCYIRHLRQQNNDVIDFISDNMQKKIEIDIPEGKVPIMEQTEKGVVITWKEKEITYADVISKLVSNQNAIYEFWSDKIHEGESSKFYKKVEVLRKLINIRNYFGGDKPTNSWIITIDSALRPFVIKNPKPYRETCFIYFDTQEHAQMAINMLGDELKYLFEPW